MGYRADQRPVYAPINRLLASGGWCGGTLPQLRHRQAGSHAPLFDQVHEAFMEDRAFLEAQQRANDRDRGRPAVDINADAGGLEARRILDRLLEEQDLRPPRQANAV